MNEEEKDIELSQEDVDDSVVAEEHAGEQVKKLKGKLKDAEAKAKEYLDGWQRSQADFVNLRKRDEEAKVEFLKFANADLVSQLMPVLDSLELSLPHGNKELEVIYRQLIQILKVSGLTQENPVGEVFNPRKHEAVGNIETENKDDDHKILEVVQKGYILQGKIIRPAKVRIGELSSK
ncbi:MAG: nucleotide exchange factor GrpE [Patescibacteria group bacterium]